MNRVAFVAYDGYLGSAGSSATDLSRVDLYHALGLFDRLAMEVLVHDALTSMTAPAITVQLAHSGNGRGWQFKNTTAEINAKRITIGVPNIFVGYDSGALPNLAMVRFLMTLSATNTPVRARVTLRVTATDGYPLDATDRLREVMLLRSTAVEPDRARTLR